MGQGREWAKSRIRASFERARLPVAPNLCRDQGTRKVTLLLNVPLGVTTVTVPVVASEGTVVVSSELETTVKVAAIPWNVTLVAPLKFVPRIVTDDPTLPDPGSVFTNGPSPIDN